MKKTKRNRIAALCLSVSFVLWTAAVCLVDVHPIGPDGSEVGFAALNGWIHTHTGVHPDLYVLTDWLGLVPVAVAVSFALLGLRQWIVRKKLSAVDRSILVLGGFYAAVMAAYLFFEVFAVNYRPVLIEGVPEVSYPSSTTMLVLCVMPTAVMQLNDRIRNAALRRTVAAVMIAFSVFMVAARLISGVHWFTDIVGGMLLSGSLVMGYRSFTA